MQYFYVAHPQIHKVWHDVLVHVAMITFAGQQYAQANYHVFCAYRSFASQDMYVLMYGLLLIFRAGNWKKSAIILFINKIYYFHDTKVTRRITY